MGKTDATRGAHSLHGCPFFMLLTVYDSFIVAVVSDIIRDSIIAMYFS
jgi:hypothetical protein